MNQQERRQVLEYIEKYSTEFNRLTADVMEKVLGNTMAPAAAEAFGASSLPLPEQGNVRINPEQFLNQQVEFMQAQQQLWQSASKAFLGEEAETVIAPEQGDKRFADPDWDGNPMFNYIKQAYLLNAQYMNRLVDSMEFDSPKMAEQVRFYTRQYVNSVAPTNFLLTNPEVCKEILQTEGENLARGMDNFMRDLEESPTEALKITQVRSDAFILGEDLANTAGSVVFKNDLIELIQYQSSTEQVRSVPLLILPPFINKYYILDLGEKKSLVKWLVDQGFTVFLVSWINPDKRHAHVDFNHYVELGVLAALDAVCDITGEPTVNAAGYCIGGTLLGMAQSILKSRGDDRIQSCTFLTTLFDFSDPGEVGNYLTEDSFSIIEKSVKNKGYFDGRVLALSFSLLRENNLFWSFFIENYLKGKDPMPFDILYWNSDSTNVPAATYVYYLRNMYLDNKLKQANALTICDTPIDLANIGVPSYCLAAQADHIVQWKSAYDSALLLDKGDNTPVRFVLTESGHVAGVVNPASKGKYPHWVAADENAQTELAVDAETWMSTAQQVQGSWWDDWCAWLNDRSGALGEAPGVGSDSYPALCAAPGEYVKVRLDNQAL